MQSPQFSITKILTFTQQQFQPNEITTILKHLFYSFIQKHHTPKQKNEEQNITSEIDRFFSRIILQLKLFHKTTFSQFIKNKKKISKTAPHTIQ